jgi:molybdate transport system regulatory protein
MPKNKTVKDQGQYRLRIKMDIGGAAIGPGKASLMHKIDALGSISAAAREMGINYRRAQLLLGTLNDALGKPVVETTKGGAAKGGANLTKEGRVLLEAYDRCTQIAGQNTADILKTLQVELSK